MKLRLKDLLLFSYIIIGFVLFVFFRSNIFVWLSFFLNFLILSIITLHHLYVDRYYSPFISAYIVFSYLFFLLAPMVQIGSFTPENHTFITGLPYSEVLTIKTNGLIILFHIVFFLLYIVFKKRNKYKLETSEIRNQNNILPLTIVFLVVISIIVFVVSYDFVMDEITRPAWKKSEYAVSSLLIYKKVLFLIPLGTIILCFQYLKSKKKLTSNILYVSVAMLMMYILLFWFKNPLLEKRNALGPIYITLIFLSFPRLLRSNTKTLSFLFFSMIVLFPLVQLFTHIDYSLQEILNNPRYLTDEFSFEFFGNIFNTLNYDAFINISATMEYVSINGFSYGYQLLSALLFFVPRSIWTSKPTSSGEVIGDYLINNHNFGNGQFNNLSNAMVSEGYLNFGIVGVVLFAIILAYVMVKFLIWLRRTDELKKMIAFYFAIHLIFLLRGDFTNGFSYFVGTFVGVIVIPKIVDKILKALFKKT